MNTVFFKIFKKIMSQKIGVEDTSIEEMEVDFDMSAIYNPFGNSNDPFNNSVNISIGDSLNGASNLAIDLVRNNALDNSQAKASASQLGKRFVIERY